MAVQFNADFNRFVDFATAQNASGKAIADAANGKFDASGLTRQVVVASGDKVGAWSRSQNAKDVNNVTRDIFYKAVADMFGGESKIPASVKVDEYEEVRRLGASANRQAHHERQNRH